MITMTRSATAQFIYDWYGSIEDVHYGCITFDDALQTVDIFEQSPYEVTISQYDRRLRFYSSVESACFDILDNFDVEDQVHELAKDWLIFDIREGLICIVKK